MNWRDKRGLTYIEVLVSILLVVVLVFALNALLTGRSLQKVNGNRVIAYQLASEELELIENKPFAALSNTSSAPFLYTLSHIGSLSVVTSTNAYSGQNVLNLKSNINQTGTITGVAVLPQNNYDDFFLDVQLLLDGTSSPVGSGKGVLFRAEDLQNGYVVTLDDDFSLKKMINGIATTTLASNAFSIAPDVWENLQINVDGDTLQVFLNGSPHFSVVDDTFTDGYVALIASQSGNIDIDDVQIRNKDHATSTWQFDNYSLGTLSDEWERLTLAVLPNGNGNVTIDDYLGNNTIKDVTVEVEWNATGATSSVQLQALLTE